MECRADMPGNATVDIFLNFLSHGFFFIFILYFYDF